MKSAIAGRDIEPGGMARLKPAAYEIGALVKEFVRHLIREKRDKNERYGYMPVWST